MLNESWIRQIPKLFFFKTGGEYKRFVFFTWNVSMASYLKLRALVSSQVEGEDEKKSLKRFPTPRWILVRSNPQQLSNKDNKKWKLWSDTEMDPTHTNPKVQQQLSSKNKNKQKCPSSQIHQMMFEVVWAHRADNDCQTITLSHSICSYCVNVYEKQKRKVETDNFICFLEGCWEKDERPLCIAMAGKPFLFLLWCVTTNKQWGDFF